MWRIYLSLQYVKIEARRISMHNVDLHPLVFMIYLRAKVVEVFYSSHDAVACSLPGSVLVRANKRQQPMHKLKKDWFLEKRVRSIKRFFFFFCMSKALFYCHTASDATNVCAAHPMTSTTVWWCAMIYPSWLHSAWWQYGQRRISLLIPPSCGQRCRPEHKHREKRHAARNSYFKQIFLP